MVESTLAVRSHLVAALKADLVGPFDPDTGEELLHLPPSRWYLTGFLAPDEGRESDDPTEAEELAAGSDQDLEEPTGQEPEPKQKRRLPASMGMTVLLPPGPVSDEIHATVTFADYLRETHEEEGKPPKHHWRRVKQPPLSVAIPLDPETVSKGIPLGGTDGIRLVGKLETTDAPGLAPNTRALSLFVINNRPTTENGKQDERFIFQVELEVEFADGLVARPNQSDEASKDWDQCVADIQYRNQFEYAVGHGVSVDIPSQNVVTRAKTTWIPQAEVRRVVTRDEKTVITSMEKLAALPDGKAVRQALTPLIEAYGAWINTQLTIDPGTDARRDTRDELMHQATQAKERIAAGIERIANNPLVFKAFTLANAAMAKAARQRNPERYTEGGEPSWRLFQLAFVLLNISGVADETHPDRQSVELIFFPTGGGKTEAYLGVIAFTLLLRRLSAIDRPDAGLGVAVLLRYTLRLLTLDQLGRAATLICALEMQRKADPKRLGDVRFSVGLWVGRSATPNTLKDAGRKITEYKNNASKNAQSPFPLTNCPWCNAPLTKDSLTLAPNRSNPSEVTVACGSFRCDFAASRNREGLPVLFVDEQIYRELPAFIVGTVDKFAMLPWRGETGMLFGRAKSRHGRNFYGPMDGDAKGRVALPDGLRSPELIVQDELHLISGPLGTMVGLYETAIEALSCREAADGKRILPKIIASTATVRRAREQIKALFARNHTAVFPPPGVDASESYFATVDHESAGRLYLGVAASGRAEKQLLLRTYVSLLSAANLHFDPEGDVHQPCDPYMTLVGYFNSLRALGGMRRLVEDEITARTYAAEGRNPIDGPMDHPWYRRRSLREPVELTSREGTFGIARSKERLEQPFTNKESVDVLLASNMISVGVDIDRLGLMVVAGQPKTTSEYIQSSSRVGRDAKRPGLVVTSFNVFKPRDRSHYERFTAYHDSFYRFVEAPSLTPFSGPALDRGLAALLISMVRLGSKEMTGPDGAMLLAEYRKAAEAALQTIGERCQEQPGLGLGQSQMREKVDSVIARGRNLLDAWQRLVDQARDGAGVRSYSPYDKDKKGKSLLFTILDEDRPEPGSDDAKFAAPTSMRDVESSVHLWIERKSLSGRMNHG